jgi:type IV secretion system protein VirB8
MSAVDKNLDQVPTDGAPKPGAPGESGTAKTRDLNWLHDRYKAATMQRNLMVFLNILALLGILFSTVTATKVIKSKSLDPFVIEIDKKTGIVTLVDQSKIKLFTPDESINNFFLVKYLRARELFDPRNYRLMYYKDVRLMSDEKVYRTFLRILRADNSQNPMSAYANNVSSSMTVRSLQYLQPNTVQVRFTVEAELPSGRSIVRNRIAIIGFKYVSTKLSEEDRYINPLGFTVVSYNSSDEVLS